MSFRRYRRLLLEAPLIAPPRRGELLSRLLDYWFRDPREQAAFGYIWKTIQRSRTHRLAVLVYAGLAIGWVAKSAVERYCALRRCLNRPPDNSGFVPGHSQRGISLEQRPEAARIFEFPSRTLRYRFRFTHSNFTARRRQRARKTVARSSLKAGSRGMADIRTSRAIIAF